MEERSKLLSNFDAVIESKAIESMGDRELMAIESKAIESRGD
jgi:hypothetical protein